MTRQMADDEVLRILDAHIKEKGEYAKGAEGSIDAEIYAADAEELSELRAAVAALQAERDVLEQNLVAAMAQVAEADKEAERAESALEALRGQVAGLVGAAQKFRDAEYARNGTGERLDAFHDARDELDAALAAVEGKG